MESLYLKQKHMKFELEAFEDIIILYVLIHRNYENHENINWFIISASL